MRVQVKTRQFKPLEKISDDLMRGYLALHEFDFIHPNRIYLKIDDRYWIIQELLSHFWDPNKPLEYYRVLLVRIPEGVDPETCIAPDEDYPEWLLGIFPEGMYKLWQPN